MAFCFCHCWTSLWILVFLLRDVSADPSSSSQYVLHLIDTPFDQASRDCSPGILTTVATKQEATKILALVSGLVPLKDEFTFWVGLKKAKNECVVPSLPLRGFRWTPDGSQESQVSQWMEEPQLTCTAVRCAALKARITGSAVTAWGLIPVSCKHAYHFICKLPDGTAVGLPEYRQSTARPATPGPELIPETPQPVVVKPEPETPEPSKPAAAETRPATSEPNAPQPETLAPRLEQTKLTELDPEPSPEPAPEPGPSSRSVPGSAPCQRPTFAGVRSFSLYPNDNNRIRVECWSPFELDLFCSDQRDVWRVLDGSPANLSDVCQPCATGFKKDASGHCEDVDECGASTPCRHTCLNTVGSFRCICVDESGNHHDDGTPPCDDPVMIEDGRTMSGVLIPVLVAVAALVVLVVVVAVTVKCCLIRRSKERATKKAEKMGGFDSFQTANEKEAT